jgi:hypothetical protein
MPTTRAEKPPAVPSEEATAEQLRLAVQQGEMFGKALKHMVGEVVDDGQEVEAGPYLVAYAIEKAEGMYMPAGSMSMGESGNGSSAAEGDHDQLIWHEPEEENIHLEVSVRDAADGRFIPGLTVHARLVDSENNDVGMHQQPFIWHPWLYHYGRNWMVPKDGDYTLYVYIEAPTFHRHDKENGKRYAHDVEVEFSAVKISSQ